MQKWMAGFNVVFLCSIIWCALIRTLIMCSKSIHKVLYYSTIHWFVNWPLSGLEQVAGNYKFHIFEQVVWFEEEDPLLDQICSSINKWIPFEFDCFWSCSQAVPPAKVYTPFKHNEPLYCGGNSQGRASDNTGSISTVSMTVIPSQSKRTEWKLWMIYW